MTEYLDRYPTMHEYAEGKRINPKLTDYISRADAIKAVASITMSIHLSDVICDKLLALPSADAVQGWIPCSERLPSESGTYLVTTAKGAVWADHFYANSVDDRHWSYRTRRVPIAWMPMPKPYKGGDTE